METIIDLRIRYSKLSKSKLESSLLDVDANHFSYTWSRKGQNCHQVHETDDDNDKKGASHDPMVLIKESAKKVTEMGNPTGDSKDSCKSKSSKSDLLGLGKFELRVKIRKHMTRHRCIWRIIATLVNSTVTMTGGMTNEMMIGVGRNVTPQIHFYLGNFDLDAASRWKRLVWRKMNPGQAARTYVHCSFQMEEETEYSAEQSVMSAFLMELDRFKVTTERTWRFLNGRSKVCTQRSLCSAGKNYHVQLSIWHLMVSWFF